MEVEDNKQSPNRHTFEDYRDPKPRSRKTYKVSNTLKNESQFNVRRARMTSYVRYSPRMRKVPYSDHPFSPRVKVTHISDHPASDNPVPTHQGAAFKRREITTIQEEIFHYRDPKSHSSFKVKTHKDKVASLRRVVKRLSDMCLKAAAQRQKPEVVLQGKVPEEVLKLFSGIQI